jgi:hypothetical protein
MRGFETLALNGAIFDGAAWFPAQSGGCGRAGKHPAEVRNSLKTPTPVIEPAIEGFNLLNR